MAPENSRVENEEPVRSATVVLVGGVTVEFPDQDSTFEVYRCAEVMDVTRFWSGSDVNILLVDLGNLSESEKAQLRKLMAQFHTALVVAVADSIDDKTCESLLRMGCVGSLRGREAPATIQRALKAVAAGELWFPRTTLSRVLRSFLAAQDPNRLTAREMEIMGLIRDDLNNQQVADKLFISRETVRWHIKSLHAKLGTRTRRGLRDHVRLLDRLGRAVPAQRESGDGLRSRAS